jgi:hypothetical protein
MLRVSYYCSHGERAYRLSKPTPRGFSIFHSRVKMGTANIQALGNQIFRCCALSILSIPFSGLFNAATSVATGKGLPDERKPTERDLSYCIVHYTVSLVSIPFSGFLNSATISLRREKGSQKE